MGVRFISLMISLPSLAKALKEAQHEIEMKTDLTPRAPACLGLAHDLPAPPSGNDERLRQLDRIEAALRRMDHGTYGKCVKCGARIDLHMLEQDPTVEVCRSCASHHTGHA